MKWFYQKSLLYMTLFLLLFSCGGKKKPEILTPGRYYLIQDDESIIAPAATLPSKTIYYDLTVPDPHSNQFTLKTSQGVNCTGLMEERLLSGDRSKYLALSCNGGNFFGYLPDEFTGTCFSILSKGYNLDDEVKPKGDSEMIFSYWICPGGSEGHTVMFQKDPVSTQ